MDRETGSESEPMSQSEDDDDSLDHGRCEVTGSEKKFSASILVPVSLRLPTGLQVLFLVNIIVLTKKGLPFSLITSRFI